MTTPKHTPAPWRKSRISDEEIVISGHDPIYKGIITIAHVYESKDDESNTTLIEAAPDMLKELIDNVLELEDLIVVIRDNPTWSREKLNAWITKKASRTIETSRAVIAKAKGE